MLKKKVIALLLAGGLLMGAASAVSIGDLSENDWAYPYVSYMLDNGIMSLESDGNFYGDSMTTRGEFILYLWRALGCPVAVTDGKSTFNDVAVTDNCYDAVEWAVGHDVTSGTSPTTFQPDWVLTREQAFTFLWRALPYFGVAVPSLQEDQLGSFQDGGDVSDWAREPMNDLYSLGIVSGTDDGYLMPLRDVVRSSTAAILYRTLNLQKGIEPEPEHQATLYVIAYGQEQQYAMGYSGELTPEKLLDGLTNLTGLNFSYTHFDVVGDELRVHWASDASFMPAVADVTENPDLGIAFYDLDSTVECMLDSAWKTLSVNLDVPRIYFSDDGDGGLDLNEKMNWVIPGDEWYSGNFSDYYQ